MITYTCDHCKKPIRDVAYVLQPQGIDSPFRGRENHLHFDCLVLFARKYTSSE